MEPHSGPSRLAPQEIPPSAQQQQPLAAPLTAAPPVQVKAGLAEGTAIQPGAPVLTTTGAVSPVRADATLVAPGTHSPNILAETSSEDRPSLNTPVPNYTGRLSQSGTKGFLTEARDSVKNRLRASIKGIQAAKDAAVNRVSDTSPASSGSARATTSSEPETSPEEATDRGSSNNLRQLRRDRTEFAKLITAAKKEFSKENPILLDSYAKLASLKEGVDKGDPLATQEFLREVDRFASNFLLNDAPLEANVPGEVQKYIKGELKRVNGLKPELRSYHALFCLLDCAAVHIAKFAVRDTAKRANLHLRIQDLLPSRLATDAQVSSWLRSLPSTKDAAIIDALLSNLSLDDPPESDSSASTEGVPSHQPTFVPAAVRRAARPPVYEQFESACQDFFNAKTDAKRIEFLSSVIALMDLQVASNTHYRQTVHDYARLPEGDPRKPSVDVVNLAVEQLLERAKPDLDSDAKS